ncbi:methylated-DNA--[protein]-cysteine S-methyltransferase [Auraticoccus monumenti]|uniref:Methylated-DNA--protein-cysteine methyltransferase n=1 Tax=Auraticoccus monumenti TaxID=675864 RepID=A0A1G6VLY2_9ACTN|nr:methylated-DNA--[protein]-cysteine S-methyltransferase [Auraticoccus monumenti]SDD54521.1 methylated-DNA-[protein]-cysteine S-methyltransferase [Auraticoccus monumenti]
MNERTRGLGVVQGQEVVQGPAVLGGLGAGTGDLLERLRDRLAVEAEGEGLVEVAWRTTDSPVGTLLLAATERGLVRVAFANEDGDEVLAVLARRLGPRVVRAPRRLERAVVELEEYFAGRRQGFDLPLDLSLSTVFRRRVQQQLARIGYGRTATYAEVAAAVENPGAVRAVGSACATNPIPIVLPCHRVLRTDGALGGYRGGADVKKVLLDLERGAA